MAAVYTSMCVKARTDEIYTGEIKKPRPFQQEKKNKYDCSFILIWKPSVLAHHQHQTSVLLCFSLWKVQPWTKATG